MARTVTPAPLPARQAFDLQAQIVADISDLRRRWVRLAGNLHAFHAAHGWHALGVDTFGEWLQDPTVGMRRAQAYTLIQAWQEFVIDNNVQPARLGEVDVSKLPVVMPALKRGDVTADEALSDCETLTRDDLRGKYRGDPNAPIDPGEPDMEHCSRCGHLRKVTA